MRVESGIFGAQWVPTLPLQPARPEQLPLVGVTITCSDFGAINLKHENSFLQSPSLAALGMCTLGFPLA